jgi:iron complex outermembrane receptor protein
MAGCISLMRRITVAWVACACIGLAGLGAGVAQAESSGATDQQNSGLLEEVVVTARRREESAQQVPISISALSGGTLANKGIDNLRELSALVPVLTVKNTTAGENDASIRLRGIPGVAVYVDGIAHSSTQGGLLDLVDVERIEVLSGPQGTLFGKNAIGGAIQYITARPLDNFGGSAKITVGSYGRTDVTGVINLPFSDTFHTKLVGASLNRDGYVRDVVTGNYYGGDDRRVARFDSVWTPVDALDARFIIAYTRETTQDVPFINLLLDPICPGNPSPPHFTGPIPSTLCVYERAGIPVNTALNYGQQGRWENASGPGDGGYNATTWDYTANIHYKFNDAWGLRSLTGYRQLQYAQVSDNDGTPLHLIDASARGAISEFTEELQLAYSGDRLFGTTGAYFYNNHTRRGSEQWTLQDLAVQPYKAAAAVYGVGAGQLNQLTQNNIDGWAGFSEWTYKLTDPLSFTAGARYTSEQNTTIVYNLGAATACCTLLSSLVEAPGGPLFAPRQATFTQTTPRLSLQYQWTPQIMTYATYSKGFDAGGFNLAGNAPFPYQPEVLTNYEVGLKSDLFNRRLRFNLAAYYGDYDKIQVQILLPAGPTVVLATQNAGKGRVEGVDMQTSWVPVDEFSVDLSAGWLDSAYTDLGGVQGVTLGTPFPFSPKFTANLGAQYTWKWSPGDITLRGDYIWTAATTTNIDPRFSIALPAYGLMNAKLTYQPHGSNWQFALGGTNLTDKFYVDQGLNITLQGWANGTPGRPREWYGTVSTKF